MLWDLFCRVVDNFGDVGFAWRLATDLGSRGESVRLRIDDASALAWMAPEGADGVSLLPWNAPHEAAEPAADVVVETFGCGLPDAYAAGLTRPPDAPVWIDVEYLTAESYAARSHGLPSPHASGPAAGLTTWFFYPGFDANTGGLLREADLDERQRGFDRVEWLRGWGIEPSPRSGLPPLHVVSLFCYANPRLPDVIEALAAAPVKLLATAGAAATSVRAALPRSLVRGSLQATVLPRLTQREYDHLLWASDVNFVRGEDSFVRAQWGGVPFVWHIYPQDDSAHVAKLEAFLDRFLLAAAPAVAGEVRRAFRFWNGIPNVAGAPLRPQPALASNGWREHCQRWRAELHAQADLGTRLVEFARSRMLK